jgi:hypothetical protein
LRLLAVSACLSVGVAAQSEPPGSMSSYGLKPSSPPETRQRSQPEPEYVFPELQEPERNPWSGVPREPYGNSGEAYDRSSNPWLDPSMPATPEALPPSRYAPEDHRERLQRPRPVYPERGRGAYTDPGYDRRYEYGYDYGYRPYYPGYGAGGYDALPWPYGADPYPGYGYGLDGYPGTDGFGMPFMGTPFDWLF